MKGLLRIVGCVTVILFGITFAEGATQNERGTPRRVREEMAQKSRHEKELKEKVMTPEEKMKREQASENRREKFRKWVIHPVKKLKPQRRPGPPSEEAAAARREKLRKIGRWDAPKKESNDRPTGAPPTTNVQSASYPENTK